MPEKTADDLARILSLSGQSGSARADAGAASAGPAQGPARGRPGNYPPGGRESSPGFDSSLFFDFNEARPRFDSKVIAMRAQAHAEAQAARCAEAAREQ